MDKINAALKRLNKCPASSCTGSTTGPRLLSCCGVTAQYDASGGRRVGEVADPDATRVPWLWSVEVTVADAERGASGPAPRE